MVTVEICAAGVCDTVVYNDSVLGDCINEAGD